MVFFFFFEVDLISWAPRREHLNVLPASGGVRSVSNPSQVPHAIAVTIAKLGVAFQQAISRPDVGVKMTSPRLR